MKERFNGDFGTVADKRKALVAPAEFQARWLKLDRLNQQYLTYRIQKEGCKPENAQFFDEKMAKVANKIVENKDTARQLDDFLVFMGTITPTGRSAK